MEPQVIMGKFETNQIDLNNNGKLILYQRPDVKNPKWQCRISVSASTGYKIFSTKETEQSKAERVALNEYEELYFKVKRGGSLKGIPFSKVFNEWKISFLSIKTPHKLLQVRQVETLGLDFFKSFANLSMRSSSSCSSSTTCLLSLMAAKANVTAPFNSLEDSRRML